MLCLPIALTGSRKLWDAGPMKAMKEKFFVEHAAKLPVKHIASPDEVAEAYIFLMKYFECPGFPRRTPRLIVLFAGAILSQARG